MVVIAGRTSHGKTAVTLQIISDLLEMKKRVLYISFEMTAPQILERMFCRKYKIDNHSLRTGHFDAHQREWDIFSDYIKTAKLAFSADFGNTWQEIEEIITTADDKPDVVVIDYINAIKGSSTPNMKGFIDEYIRHFKQLASENNFSGVLVCQVNRTNPDSKDKAPKLHQLQGSSHLENHSDVVILLDWLCKHTETEDKSFYTLHLAKNRNGRTGYIRLVFEPEYYNFKEYEEETPYQHAMMELNQ